MVGGRDAGRLRRQIRAVLPDSPALAEWQQRVLGTFLAFPAARWRLLVRRPWPGDAADAALVLIGPPGVLVVSLPAAGAAVDPLLAATRRVEQILAERGLSPVAVRAVVIRPGDAVPEQRANVLLTSERHVRELAERRPPLLTVRHIWALADQLDGGEYGLPEVPARGAAAAAGRPDEALLDSAAVLAARRAAVLAGPVEEWLSFLDARQLGVVRRDYRGPARISGPAGTGKTVVALHRMASFARRSAGRLLYVTFVRNLPQVAASMYRRLAPESAHRAEFTHVHAWAQDLLLRRGVALNADRRGVDAAFAQAWSRVGEAGPLSALAADRRYWREEIDHVVKGRGVAELAEYRRLPRTGRRLRLDVGGRNAMWQLYTEYQQLLDAHGVADHNDVLLAAAAELRRTPLEPPYAVVVADEAQDINLIGLRLLHLIGGDRPNALLLVGDGQQAVYPVASRLSEAGIPIQGRAETLRVNYRNAQRVLAVAREVDPVNRFDDLDGVAAVRLRDVDATLPGGATQHYTATTPEDHDVELVTALRCCRVRPADIAVLTSTPEAASHYRRVLHAAQIPAVRLADYEGRRIDAVKVGTIRRAKGLEFKAVFLPGHDRAAARVDGGADERREVGVRETLVGLTRARDFLWTGSVIGG